MIDPLCQWQKAPKAAKGILVGCDSHQEWLLSWWWEIYSSENNFPVTFADFGMSEQAKAWCRSHGELIAVDVDTSFVKSSNEIDFAKRERWKWAVIYGSSLRVTRHNWFKKPFACLMSPYSTTIWIDLDCEILYGLDDLFASCTSSSPLAMVREFGTDHLPCMHPDIFYNGGVMVFVHGCDIIVKWAEACLVRSDEFWSDDNLLSALISELCIDVAELPEEYNWKMLWGVNINAIIAHWVGSCGKDFIKSHGGIKQRLQKLFKNEN